MQKLLKFLGIFISVVVVIGVITGCTNVNLKNESAPTVYFHKGVYKADIQNKNNSYIDFYVFYDENSGYTEDSKMGIGLPFSCVQEDGSLLIFSLAPSANPDNFDAFEYVKKYSN